MPGIILALLLWNTAGKIKRLRLPEVNFTDLAHTANWSQAISDDSLLLLLLPAPDVIDTSLLWDCCSAQLAQSAEKSFCESAKLTAALTGRSVGELDGSVIYRLKQGWIVFSFTFDSCRQLHFVAYRARSYEIYIWMIRLQHVKIAAIERKFLTLSLFWLHKLFTQVKTLQYKTTQLCRVVSEYRQNI